MNLSKFINKYLFEILAIILIICLINQLYMMMEYKNISKETLAITILLAGINIFLDFSKKQILVKNDRKIL